MSAVLVSGPGSAPTADMKALRGLLREIGDLKRIRSAGRTGSIASRLFGSAWSALVAGAGVGPVALHVTARAIAAARLADLDADCLKDLGLDAAEAAEVQRGGFDDLAPAVPPNLREPLRVALAEAPPDGGSPPGFVTLLAAQPRAGVTCPGRPRIVLQPPETHAEHCLAVGVYGVLLSPRYGADPATVFLAGLAHHLHNATMPDAGFTGEMLLGDHLGPAMAVATRQSLNELPAGLRREVEAAREILPNANSPEGRTFHAADVIDRVLEIDHHLAAARLTMAEVLGPMALVHDGPVKPFQDRVLAEFGLP